MCFEGHFHPCDIFDVRSPVKNKKGYALTNLYVYEFPLTPNKLGFEAPKTAYRIVEADS